MTARTCPRCGADVLRGLDSTVAGIPVTLDAAPVDNVGELLALGSGRRTYRVSTSRDGLSICRHFDERTAAAIRTSTRWERVHPEHRCGQPLPAGAEQPTGWDQEIRF